MRIVLQFRFLISLIVLCACIPATARPANINPKSAKSEVVNVSSINSLNPEMQLAEKVKKQREQVEFWDTWNIRFLFIAGFAAICLVVTAIGVSRSNKN